MNEIGPDLEFPSIDSDPILYLQIAFSVGDVARVLGLDPERFFNVVRHAQDGTYYRRFQIPKKSGGQRNISAPQKGLGLAQTRLAAILLKKYTPKKFVKGYVKGESFFTNAGYHERKQWILNIDIENFYESITFPRVRGLFMSEYFGFNNRVATILARITTTASGLPLGARTSPILANLIAANLDRLLYDIAKRNRLRYTRYADDITFSSSDKRIVPSLIETWDPLFGNRKVKLGSDLLDAFAISGFSVNHAKTRLLFKFERQEVTGLTVNKFANIRRRDISKLRMILHSAKIHGAEKAGAIWVREGATDQQFWEFVVGWLAYIRQIRGKNDPVLAKLCKLAVTSGLSGPDWVVRSADMVRQFDVFLSHASEDKDKVRRLKSKFEEAGIRVFFDEDSIAWGDSIVEKINHGLLKSSYFMPYLSDTFARKGWANRELNSAISMMAQRKGRILPIKDYEFSIEDNYPLLNEILYMSWPSSDKEEDFLNEITDKLLLLVERERSAHHDLG